jgi:hypothetical protein
VAALRVIHANWGAFGFKAGGAELDQIVLLMFALHHSLSFS